jgi:hypothetical protein
MSIVISAATLGQASSAKVNPRRQRRALCRNSKAPEVVIHHEISTIPSMAGCRTAEQSCPWAMPKTHTIKAFIVPYKSNGEASKVHRKPESRAERASKNSGHNLYRLWFRVGQGGVDALIDIKKQHNRGHICGQIV